MEHQHPKWKHLGFLGKYTLCVVDELNYAVYNTKQPSGYKHSVGYYGSLASALNGLLERLIRDKASADVSDEISALVNIIRAAKDEVLAFGNELDARALH